MHLELDKGLLLMKKIFLIIFLGVIMTFLSSCSIAGTLLGGKGAFFKDYRAIANATFEELIKAIESKDKETLKSLFSENAISEAEDFDAAADDLFNYFQGKMTSYDDHGGAVAGTGLRSQGKEWYSIGPSYIVYTDKQEYHLGFRELTVNEFESRYVGIWSLYIISASEYETPYIAYRGDGWDNAGINIGKTFDESKRQEINKAHIKNDLRFSQKTDDDSVS